MKVFITLAAFAVAGLGSALVTPSASAQTNPRSVTISDADCTAALRNSLVNGSGQAKSSGSNSWNYYFESLDNVKLNLERRSDPELILLPNCHYQHDQRGERVAAGLELVNAGCDFNGCEERASHGRCESLWQAN